MAVASVHPNSIHKQVFGEFQDPIPEGAKVQKLAKFAPGSKGKLGKEFIEAMLASHEGGVSFAGNSDTYATTSLVSPKAMDLIQATVNAAQAILTVRVSDRVMNASVGSQAAFVAGAGMAARVGMRSMHNLMEALLFYGGAATGMGSITAISGSSTTRALTVSAATAAHGILRGKKGWSINIYKSSDASLINTNAAVVISSVVPQSNQSVVINVTLDSSDGTSLDTAVGAETCYFNFYGERSGSTAITGTAQTLLGFDGIVSATSLYGQTVSSYADILAPQSLAVNANLDLGSVLMAGALSNQAGIDNGATLFVCPRAFALLGADQSSFRRFGGEMNVKNGIKSLEIEAPCGPVDIVSSSFVKPQEAFLVPMGDMDGQPLCFRPGINEVSMQNALNGEDAWIQRPEYTAWDLRVSADFGLYHRRPSGIVKLTGLTY